MATNSEAKVRSTHTVVVGAGPGGYVAAIRLAQLGVPTILVEKGELGGTCLNVGCIPSKALISASKLVQTMKHASAMGIEVDGVRIDLRKMMSWKDTVVGKLTGGVGGLVNGNGATIVRGTARFTGPHTLAVDGAEPTTITFENAIIATGSVPTALPGFAFGPKVLSSTEGLAFTQVPERLVIIGGGYIGMELGGVWQRLGTAVTVVEYMDQLLPGFAPDLVRPVAKRFKDAGGEVLLATRAVGWEASGDGVRVHLEERGTGVRKVLDADYVLLTVGRRPLTDGLGLEALGVHTDERGFIQVDGAQRTNVPHVYAIGDVAGQPMLAHKASREGEVCAEVIAGHPAAFDARAIPAVVFTDPEIATVGLSQAEATAEGYEVAVGKFLFAANGRALSLNEPDGFVRAIVDKASGVLLGVEAVGAEVSNLIAEAALAIEMGAQASEVGETIHAHPTLAEAFMEAANAALGKAVHAINRR